MVASPRGPIWLYRPWLDLLIGCGGWSAPLLLLAAWSANSRASAWSFAFYLLALIFNYPHFMATIYRAYHSYAEFHKYRFFTVHLALLLALTGLIAHLWYPLLPWVFTLYICWSPWHYTGQNFGLLMMFARRAGLDPTEGERRALHLSFVASFILLMLSFHTGPSGDPLILSLGLPAKFTLPARATLAVFFVAASGWALSSFSRRTPWRAILPAATLVLTQFLWFLMPAIIELASGRGVPQTRYSSGILAVLHSAQYLWVTSYYQEREARAEGQTHWSFPRYLLTLVAGGIALFIPGPWIVSRLFHADFAASFLAFTALVNIHHFLLDGAIWKLRDSRIATFLLNDPAAASSGQGNPTGVAAFFQWIAGASPAARALRIGTLVVLLLWGGLDRLRFYWANDSSSLSSLRRAARLNPDDSSVQTHLARAAEAAGDRAAALEALRRAAEINPDRISAQEAYARALILSGNNAEAYALYRTVLQRNPNSVDALVNFGLLAHNLGKEQEAVDSWQRAVDTDPLQANAQLYLAQALDQQGEHQAAARHYLAYLQAVGKNTASHQGEGEAVIIALLKIGDAEVEAGHPDRALPRYRAAAQFANKSANPSLESMSLAHAAEALEQSGSIGEAAQAWQQAILLDETQGQISATASDWFNYGQFLARHGQSEQLIFACFLRAEDLQNTTPGETLSTIVRARQASAARLGPSASSAVSSRLSKTLSAALSLPPDSFPRKS